jgi:hypothetical protein
MIILQTNILVTTAEGDVSVSVVARGRKNNASLTGQQCLNVLIYGSLFGSLELSKVRLAYIALAFNLPYEYA